VCVYKFERNKTHNLMLWLISSKMNAFSLLSEKKKHQIRVSEKLLSSQHWRELSKARKLKLIQEKIVLYCV
jgi:hypothetical protein